MIMIIVIIYIHVCVYTLYIQTAMQNLKFNIYLYIHETSTIHTQTCKNSLKSIQSSAFFLAMIAYYMNYTHTHTLRLYTTTLLPSLFLSRTRNPLIEIYYFTTKVESDFIDVNRAKIHPAEQNRRK